MVRKPVVAGQFYEREAKPLKKQIKECFVNSPGPGSLPEGSSDREIKGAIVPHAGFVFSGYAAAHTYKAIAESRQPDAFIVIGPSHSALGQGGLYLDDFETPLGTMKLDRKLAELINQYSGLGEDQGSHLHEHSVEVQLPFLQFIYQDKVKFVPVVVSEADYTRIGNGIKRAISEYGGRVSVLASSDFTHYGFNFGYTPFTQNIRQNLTELDDTAFRFIREMDSQGFMEYINKTGATICGKYPIAILLESVAANKVTKLSHYSSGDIVGDFSSAVDYISAIME